jgi:2-dehydropantoate 2-reductase
MTFKGGGTPMKIAVFGAGGIGGYYGARLASAGSDVHFIARGAHLAAIRTQGLRVNSANGDLHIHPARVTDDAAAVGAADVVLVTVKLYDTVPEDIRPLVGPETVVLSFQNGVTAAESLAAAFGPERVIGGMTQIISFIAAPGVIAHGGTMAKLVFGELDGRRSPRVEAFHEVCAGAGIDTEISPDIEADIWSKFIFLAPFSGVTALMRLPIGAIREDKRTRALYRRATEEVFAVARAKGIRLPGDLVDRHMEFIDGLPEDMGSSMLHDLTQGRRLELSWLSGTVVSLGRELGQPTPTHDFIEVSLKLHADGSDGGI